MRKLIFEITRRKGEVKRIVGIAILAVLVASSPSWGGDSVFFTPQQGKQIQVILETAFPGENVSVKMADDWHFCLVQCWIGDEKYIAFRVYNPRVDTSNVFPGIEELSKEAVKLEKKIKAIFKGEARK